MIKCCQPPAVGNALHGIRTLFCSFTVPNKTCSESWSCWSWIQQQGLAQAGTMKIKHSLSYCPWSFYLPWPPLSGVSLLACVSMSSTVCMKNFRLRHKNWGVWIQCNGMVEWTGIVWIDWNGGMVISWILLIVFTSLKTPVNKGHPNLITK